MQRNIFKKFRVNKSEAEMLQKKAKKAGMNESALIRSLIRGYAPRERPGDELDDVLDKLSYIGEQLNRIAVLSSRTGQLDSEKVKEEILALRSLKFEIKKEFLSPVRTG